MVKLVEVAGFVAEKFSTEDFGGLWRIFGSSMEDFGGHSKTF